MSPALILTAVAAAGAVDMQQVLDQIRIEQDVPGVSAVVTHKNKIVFAGASGVADLESKREMTADTVLYAGSVTKVFTAVVALNLVENGKMSLEDSVEGIARNAPGGNEQLRVRHLLTHTSGLKREGDFDYWFNANFPDKAALAAYLTKTKLHSRPGEKVSYSNIGYAALGPVIERASGRSYAETLSSLVFGPLGMRSSGTGAPEPGMSAGYSPSHRVLPNDTRPFAGLGRSVGDRYIREYHDAKAMTPAFGAFTTARDLSKLARFLLGYGDSHVLSDDMRAKMLTAQAGARGLGIRLGNYKGRAVARHGGWFAAHQSHLLLARRSGVSVVVLTNSDNAAPAKIAEALLDATLR